MNNNKSLGFSLPELLVTVAVASILAAFALPNLKSMIETNGVKAYANQVVSNLYLARSESAKTGYPVKICPSDTPTSTVCSSSNQDYAAGWFGFLDLNNNGLYEPSVTVDWDNNGSADIAEKVLFTTEPNPAYVLEIAYSNSSSGTVGLSSMPSGARATNNTLTYLPNGALQGQIKDVHFKLSLAKEPTDTRLRVNIEPTGRVRTCDLKRNTNC
ncbi:GspH/FimT family pseudopilin [Thiolinea disciformis]|uniref:GspH/FimT family pseudopilin n=1 Tax=Thiolinea disciformis TaxID=125614 RepID=UPI00037A40E3|nr:GspH/FimT family pseudopilin [Thiolinea disciformis]